MKKEKKRGRVLRRIGYAMAALIVFLYIVLPFGMGAFAAIRPPRVCGDAPEGFKTLELAAPDGVKLAGWYAPGDNGAAILLLHGAKGNRDAVRPYAQFLRNNGFGVLAIDLRGHGMSGGRANAFGWECSGDMCAAVEFLQRQPGVEAIGALGVSLGGEVLLGAASEFPQIRAIASDGASQRCTADYIALPANNNLMRSWTNRAMYWSVGLFTGNGQPRRIVDSIAEAPGTSLLLIAAGTSSKETDYNTLFQDIAGSRAELWIVPDAGHTEAFAKYQDEYTGKVIEFFQNSLLGPPEP